MTTETPSTALPRPIDAVEFCAVVDFSRLPSHEQGLENRLVEAYAEIRAHEAEMAQGAAETARVQVALERAELALAEERAAREGERAQLLARAHAAERAFLRYRRELERAWRIIRRWVSPAQVEEFRKEEIRDAGGCRQDDACTCEDCMPDRAFYTCAR